MTACALKITASYIATYNDQFPNAINKNAV